MIEISHEIVSDPTTKIVLVVEDEVLVRLWLAVTLRDVGFQVIEAGNADEAMDVVASGIRPLALVTDVRMPGSKDGLELATALRRRLPELVVVVTSGHLIERPHTPAIGNGVDVATTVARLLSGSTTPQERLQQHFA